MDTKLIYMYKSAILCSKFPLHVVKWTLMAYTICLFWVWLPIPMLLFPFCYCRNYEQIARSQRHAVSTCTPTTCSDCYMYVPVHVYQMRLLILMHNYYCLFLLFPSCSTAAYTECTTSTRPCQVPRGKWRYRHRCEVTVVNQIQRMIQFNARNWHYFYESS